MECGDNESLIGSVTGRGGRKLQPPALPGDGGTAPDLSFPNIDGIPLDFPVFDQCTSEMAGYIAGGASGQAFGAFMECIMEALYETRAKIQGQEDSPTDAPKDAGDVTTLSVVVAAIGFVALA